MRPATRGEFKVALFCALPREADAVKALFDETYDDVYHTADANVYVHGKINQHNVVLCYMPGMGKASAAGVAANSRTSYPGILLAIVVGICGAVPFSTEDEGVKEIVLGDVLISDSVVEYDFGRQYPDGFRRKHDPKTSLGRPSPEIRAILSSLKTTEIRNKFHERLHHHLQTLQAQDSSWRYPGTEHDILYEEQNSDKGALTNGSDKASKVIHRSRLDEDTVKPMVHIGTIASADTVMKSGKHRDKLAEVEDVIGFEMEGAGVWDNFPCIIIKGVCDYADSHKNKSLQPYAAATGASAAKVFLEYWRPNVQKVIPEIDKRCLGDLLLTDPRDDKLRIEHSKGGLLRESFYWVFEHSIFQQWWQQEDSAILWIRGDAGKGKTMLTIGIIDELSKRIETSSRLDKSPLLSYFICQGTDLCLNNATCTLRGLLYLLAVQQPTLLRHLRSKYEHAERQLFEGINAVYSLVRILNDVFQDSDSPQIYLVVDAIDECEANLTQLLHLITQSTTLNSKVKWIVSSRNRDDIELHLAKCAKQRSLRLEQNSDQISHAIDNFIDTRVSELPSLQSYLELQEKLKTQIREKSDGTFLWAALVIGELGKDVFAADMLEILEQAPTGLTPLFDQMMKRVQKLNPKNAQRCLQMLSAAALAYRPLHLLEMRVVAGLPETFTHLKELDRLVNMCSSFLTVRKDYVYFIHQSVKDYLTINQSAVIFSAGCEQVHYEIYSRSLIAMSGTLRQDICKLKDPGPVALESRPQTNDFISIKYACVHWFDHLYQYNKGLKAGNQEVDDMGKLHTFFTEHLLHWLESLGLMKEVSAGILIIKKLLESFQPRFNCDLTKLLQDSMRLVLTYGPTIEEAPLQIYSGALAFCPENSEIKRIFWKSRLPFIRSVAGVQKRWGSLQVLEGHKRVVNDLCISPDGQTIATASYDCTIKLWDATTGFIKQTLEGHKNSVNSISFLQDSQSLVSGSDDGRALKWNTITADYEEILKSSERKVTVVAFSMKSNALIVGLSSGTVLLRNPVTGVWNGIFQGTINYSDDTRKDDIISDEIIAAFIRTLGPYESRIPRLESNVSHDGTEEYIEIDRRLLLQHFETRKHMDSNPVNALHISPDGQLLACRWTNGTVRLWCRVSSMWKDIHLGGSVTALAFSPDSLTLALGLSQDEVQIWDTRSVTWAHTIKHTFLQRSALDIPITALAFSQDGQSLYLAWGGQVFRWNFAIKQFYAITSDRDKKERIDTMTIMKDGQILLSCKHRRVVYICGTNFAGLEDPLVDGFKEESTHAPGILTNSVCFLFFSAMIFFDLCRHDGNSWWTADKNFKIRALMIGCGIICCLPGIVLELYVYTKSRPLRKLRQRIREARQIARENMLQIYQRKGYHMVQNDKDDDLWYENPTTGELEMKGHFSSVDKMAISPDGCILATGSLTTQLYDTMTNTWMMSIGDVVRGKLLSMWWCPDSRNLCVIHREFPKRERLEQFQIRLVVKLFDVKTRACVKTFQKGETGITGCFHSEDGHFLVCVFADNTMELWDAASLTCRKVLRGHKGAISDVSFCPDNQKLASVSDDGTIRLWDVGLGACRYVIKFKGLIIRCIWAPNGLILALAVLGGKVRLWNIGARAWGPTFDTTAMSAKVIAFSPGSHTLALPSNDYSVSCWDTVSGVRKRTIEVEEEISHLSFSDEQNLNINEKSVDISSKFLKALQYRIDLSEKFLLEGGEWITLGNQKLIWLPPDYRTRSVAAYNSTVALGHANGRITFLNLSYAGWKFYQLEI